MINNLNFNVLIITLCIVNIAGCKSFVKNDKEIIAETKNDSEKIAEQKELNIAEIGDVYFNVNVTKNNKPY